MKAIDIKPGAVIATGDWQGWTVADMGTAAAAEGDDDGACLIEVVLLELERRIYGNPLSGLPVSPSPRIVTRRTWMRADETIEIERDE